MVLYPRSAEYMEARKKPDSVQFSVPAILFVALILFPIQFRIGGQKGIPVMAGMPKTKANKINISRL